MCILPQVFTVILKNLSQGVVIRSNTVFGNRAGMNYCNNPRYWDRQA